MTRGRRRRRQEVLDLAQRYKNLAPEQAEHVDRAGRVLLATAVMSGALQIRLLVTYVRAIRQLRANRRHGWRVAMAAIRPGPKAIATASCLYGCYTAFTKMLLLRWAKQAVERAEHGLKSSEQEPRR